MIQAGRGLVAVVVFIGTWTVPGASQVTLLRYPEIRVAQAKTAGSSARYTCLAAVNRNRDQAEVHCSGRRGRALAQAVLVRVSDGTTLVSATVSGRSFAVSLANPTAAAVNALLEGDLRIQLLSGRRLEAQGTFQTPRRGLTWTHYQLSETSALRQTRRPQLDGYAAYEGDAVVVTSRNPTYMAVDAVTPGFEALDFQLTRNGQTLFQSDDGIGPDGVFSLTSISGSVANQVSSVPTDLDLFGASGRLITGPSDTCHPGPTTHCLSDNRFQVDVEWEKPNGQTGRGQASQPPFLPRAGQAGEAGLFYFSAPGKPESLELLLEMLDRCLENGSDVSATGTTDLGLEVTVTDTESGLSIEFSNPVGTKFTPLQDTSRLLKKSVEWDRQIDPGVLPCSQYC